MNQQMIVCSNCKTPNPARNLYCQSCGRPLIAASPYPTYPATPDMTQPVPSQPTVPASPTYPPPTPAYTPPSAPPQAEYTPPPQQPPEYIPPTPQQPTYVPPVPQQPTYTPPPTQPQYPPQPAYPQQPGLPPNYTAPAPYPAQPAEPDFFQKLQTRADTFFKSMKKQSFNAHVDGWSDLVAGEGEKAVEIEQGFEEELTARGLTNMDLERVEVVNGLQGRTYLVAKHQAGSVSVYVSAAGKDLMLGWDLNVAQKPSWKRMGILLLAAVILSFFLNLINFYNFGGFLVGWISGAFSWAFNFAILGLIAGMVMKGDLWYMFVERPEAAAKQELAALAMAVHQCLAAAVKKVGLDESVLRRKDKFKMG